MTYQEFIHLLAPTISFFKERNKEFKNLFGEDTLSFNQLNLNDVQAFETQYQLTIPAFYKEFLINYNPKDVEVLLGIEEIGTALKNTQLNKVGLLPISSNGSGDFYCIKQEDDSIYFADHETHFSVQKLHLLKDFFQNMVTNYS